MKKIIRPAITLLAFLLCSYLPSAAKQFQNERLNYVISYKWGLIHKDAGEATLSLKRTGDIYDIMLTAKTKPWADRIYQVRDTLSGSMRVGDLRPISYRKLTHEKGEYKKDEIFYSYSDGVTSGRAIRHRKDGKVMKAEERTLTASGPVYDMLSVFYFLRQLDFDSMAKGKVYTATIFSGKRKETIRIRCLGKETIKLKDKTKKEAYHLSFNFTHEGGKKSSDDMETWMSTSPDHVPLYLVGKLPVGEVRATLTGN